MTDKELAAQLRQMKINTKSIICLGCEHENNCGIHGCNIIGAAADRLKQVANAVDIIAACCEVTNGILHRTYLEIWELLDPTQDDLREAHVKAATEQKKKQDSRKVSPIQIGDAPPTYVTDFELCDDPSELARALQYIDSHRYFLVCATQNKEGQYTVIFRRPAP